MSEKLRTQKWALENSGKSLPVYANSTTPGLKIHLGSGPINIQGWVNIDGRAYEHVHLVAEGFALTEFADGGVSEIYLCHVLEHFSFEEAEELLKNLKRKLRKGGLIRISVPSFDKLIAVYKESNSNLDVVKFALMGGQDYQYNFHKSIYNQDALGQLLGRCGFSGIQEWDTLADFGVSLGDWSNGTFSTAHGERQISLNLKGTA